MARSRRKTPKAPIILSGFNKGDKENKLIGHRAYRSAERNALAGLVKALDDEPDMPNFKEYNNPYNLRLDGKQRYFDSKKHPEMMRK